jgi:hypothetical protein
MKQMKKQGMMMNKYLAITLSTVITSTLMSFSATAADEETYTFVGFGLTNYNDLANLELSKHDIDLVPEVSFGIGKKYQLNQDWQLATEISLQYAKAHFSGVVVGNDMNNLSQNQQYFSGNYEALGIWATTRFKYVGLSEKVSPFIELAVGGVETNHATLFGEEKNHGLAYKAIAGVEFEIFKDVSFSLGFGTSNNDNNNL